MRTLAPLAVDGREYRLRPLPPLGRVPVLLCEAPVDAPLPRYPLRRHLRGRVEAVRGGAVVVFTDAARSAEVWSLSAGGGAGTPRRTRERLRPAGAPAHESAPWLAGLVASPRSPRLALPVTAEHPAVLLPLLLLRLADRRLPLLLRRGGIAWRLLRDDPARYGVADVESAAPVGGAVRLLPGVDLRQLAHDAIEHPAGPAVVGAAWRALLTLRVLHAGCGGGDWLLDAMTVLEPLYLATLEQMRVWLAEERLERRPRRSGLLRDFEAALGAAGSASAAAFAREAIVLCNLHGVEDDPALLVRCRRRLAARLRPRDAPAGLLPPAALRLEAGTLAGGIARRSDLARALAGSADAGARLGAVGEEAEALGRAERLLRRSRLAEGMAADSLATGLRLLAARKRALSRELDAVSGAPGSLHPFAVWNDVARAGGFHLVHGARA